MDSKKFLCMFYLQYDLEKHELEDLQFAGVIVLNFFTQLNILLNYKVVKVFAKVS